MCLCQIMYPNTQIINKKHTCVDNYMHCETTTLWNIFGKLKRGDLIIGGKYQVPSTRMGLMSYRRNPWQPVAIDGETDIIRSRISRSVLRGQLVGATNGV